MNEIYTPTFARRVLRAAPDPSAGTKRFAIIGDSRTNNAFASSSTTAIQARGYPFWVEFYSNGGARFPGAWNFGVAGENSTQIRARLAAALVTAADAAGFVILAGTNDTTGAPMVANLEAMVASILDAGKVCVVIAETPRDPTMGSWTTTRIRQHLQLHRTLVNLQGTPGVRVVNAWPDLVDPASTTGAPIAAVVYDGLHFTCEGSRRIGAAVWAALSDLCKTPAVLPSTLADAYHATDLPLGNHITNPLMAGTAGTKAGTGAPTGNVADGWTLNSTANFTTSGAKVTSGGRDWQQVTFTGTPTNANQVVSLTQTLTAANFAAGDVVEGMCLLEVDAGSVANCGPQLEILANGNASYGLSQGIAGYQNPAGVTSYNPTVAYAGLLITPQWTIPASFPALTFQVSVRAASGVLTSGVFRVTAASLRKVA